MTSAAKHTLAILILMVAALTTFGMSQGGRQRVLEKLLSAPEPDEPVEVVGVQVNDRRGGKREIRFGGRLDDEDNWLKGLVVRVKNLSGRPIIYIRFKVLVSVPTPEDPKHSVGLIISYGNYPDETKNRASDQKAVGPGEVAEIKLADRQYETLKSLFESESGKASYDKVSILLGDVVFADGNIYQYGRVKKYEPRAVSKTGRGRVPELREG